jgi:hypothetical protein
MLEHLVRAKASKRRGDLTDFASQSSRGSNAKAPFIASTQSFRFERTEPNWVFWDADHVSYSRYDATGPIYLPPNWLDNWLAKLP